MKTALIALMVLASFSAFAQEKQLICEYEGSVTLEEPGFWLQSKKRQKLVQNRRCRSR